MTRVISCRFMRISCSEEDHPLFRRFYARYNLPPLDIDTTICIRSNRQRGVKLLRCFPHCCPEHIQRCYCGTSVHVLVTFATEVVATDKLVVCARFEPSREVPLWPMNLPDTPESHNDGETKLQPGQVVSLPIYLLPSGNRKARQTVWIRADREGESKQTTKLLIWCVLKNAVLYVLNNHRFPKWLYSYDSSVTRTQREMTHHLVVYVFQLTGSRSSREEVEAAVLARHESPGFSLISYRRSGIHGCDACCDLPAIEISSDSTFAAVEVDSTLVISSTSDAMEVDCVGRSLWQSAATKLSTSSDPFRRTAYHQQTGGDARVHKISPVLRLSTYPWSGSTDKYDSGVPAAVETPSSWQRGLHARNCGFREKGQHLLMLWHFLQSISIEELGFGANTVDVHVRPHWLRAAAILRAASPTWSVDLERVVASFLSGIFNSVLQTYEPNSTEKTKPVTRETAVIQITGHLFLRALLVYKVQNLLRSMMISGSSASFETQLQDRFVSLISNVYDQFEDILQEVAVGIGDTFFGNQNISLSKLVDEVLSIVYTQPRFGAVRQQVSALLLGQQTLSDALDSCLQSFVAVIREGIIAPSGPPSKLILSSEVQPGGGMLWNQRWLLDPGSLQMVDVALGKMHGTITDLPLLDVAQFIYEFGCIDVAIENKSPYLSIRSAFSVLEGSSTTFTTLALDGKLRVFHVIRSGVSSFIATTGGWVDGDYTAMLSSDGHSMAMQFFGFAEGKLSAGRPPAQNCSNGEIQKRRIDLSIKLEEESNNKGEMKPDERKDLFAFAYGTVYGSSYQQLPVTEGSQIKTSVPTEFSSLDRAAIWREAKWTALWKFQAMYIALPRLDTEEN
ncbi:hypothetical protein PHMEG_00026544 [Phytophthora megakarya]|uniref:Uncharacterized protein n=1 Tax=Phytophthora megakarya TaxID=4795 RepID=A0A225VAR2_9STRA|nr:hypothetical protein PHMEG_00026544 [Phytophthora megakarya]